MTTTFQKHLATLDNSSQKISAVSSYMRIKISDAKVLSQSWLQTIENSNTPRERLLSLIYLANDVIMKPGDSALVYSKELEPLLPNALATTARRSIDSVPRLHRMLGIWKDGQKFGEASLLLMKERILAGEADAVATSSLSSGSSGLSSSEFFLYSNEGRDIESIDSSSVNTIIEGSSLSALHEAQRRRIITRSVVGVCSTALTKGSDFNVALNLANSSAKPSVDAAQKAFTIVSTAEKAARLSLACARINQYRRQATLAKLTEAIDVQTGKMGQIEIEKYEDIERKLLALVDAESKGHLIRERGRAVQNDSVLDMESNFSLPTKVTHESNIETSNQSTKKRTLAEMKLRYAASAPLISKQSNSDVDLNSSNAGTETLSAPSQSSVLNTQSTDEIIETAHIKKARVDVGATSGVGREGSLTAARKVSPKSTVGTFMALSLPQTRFVTVSNGASLVNTAVGGVVDPSFDAKNRGVIDDSDDDEDDGEPVVADADAGFKLQSVDDVFAGRRYDGVRKEWVIDDSRKVETEQDYQ
jgi:hypothetical protein